MNLLRSNATCALLSAGFKSMAKDAERRLDTRGTCHSRYFSSRTSLRILSEISFAAALCWSSETLPCFSSRRFDPLPPPPLNSTIYPARRGTASSFLQIRRSIIGRAPLTLSDPPVLYASIAFSWHTVMKIYKGAYRERERTRTRGGSSWWLIAVLEKFPWF